MAREGFGESRANVDGEFVFGMNARARALNCIFFSYFLLCVADILRAQAIDLSQDSDRRAPELNDSRSGAELPYSPNNRQASASIPGASPTLKTPSPVRGLCWSDSNGYFALTEQNAVFIRDGYDSRLVHTMGYDGAMSLQFAWDVVTQSDMFMALSAGGKFSVWNFNDFPNQIAISNELEPSYSAQFPGERRVTASAFSPSGNHMAVAFDDGTVNLAIVLHYTQKISDKNLAGHFGNVFSLDFSRNDGFLASAGLDDRIFIWNATDGSKVNSLPFYGGSGAGVLFTADSAAIISLERPDLITVRQFDGTRIRSIVPNGRSVKTLKLTSGGYLAALTAQDNIELYDLTTGEYIGYIPPFNQTSLTSFAFNRDDSVLLTGHADGSVYKLRFGDVFLEPDQLPPETREVKQDEVVVKGSDFKEKLEKEKEPEKKKDEKKKEDKEPEKEKEELPPAEKSLALNFGLAARTLPDPYMAAFDLDVKARYVATRYFFCGGGASFGLGFPKRDFPVTYTLNGAKYDPPYFLAASFYTSAGLLFRFKNGKAPYIFFELDPGARIEKLFQSKNGSVVTTKWRAAFGADLTLGAGWRYFEFGGGIDFDTILGVRPRVIICGKIPIELKKKADKKAAGEEAPK